MIAGQAGAFGAVFAVLYAAHVVADHWVQTNQQARDKGGSGWSARLADVRHVASLTAVKVLFLGAAGAVLGLRVPVGQAVAGLLIDAVSHYWADRRFTLARLAAALGKAEFYALGSPRPGRDDNPSLGTGAYALDQSWHIGWLFVAALVVAA